MNNPPEVKKERKAIIDGSDVLAGMGLVILAVGLYLINGPMMLVVVGTILLLTGLIGAFRKAK